MGATEVAGQGQRSLARLGNPSVQRWLTPVAATTLGKHLLLGEGWDGELDFSDQSSALIYLKRVGLLP